MTILYSYFRVSSLCKVPSTLFPLWTILFSVLWGVEVGAQPEGHFQRRFFQRYSIPEGLSSSTILHMIEDNRGFIWMAGVGGLYRFDGHEFYPFSSESHVNGKSQYPNIETFTHILEDSAGDFWIGTGRQGLLKLDRLTGQFTSFPRELDSTNSISHPNVTSILEGPSGTLWVGTANGLNVFDSKTETFSLIDFPNSSLATSTSYIHVFDLARALDGNIWIATIRNGLFKMNVSTLEFEKLTLPWEEIDDKNQVFHRTNSVLEDSRGNLWIGTSAGLYRRSPGGDMTFYEHKSDEEHSLGRSYANGIIEDHVGNIWIATSPGLSLYDHEYDQFQNFDHDEFDAFSAGLGSAHFLMEDSQQNIWVGLFGGGVNRISQNQGSFIQYSGGSSQFHDVRGLTMGPQGELWIGDSHGQLYTFDPVTRDFDYFDLQLPVAQSPNFKHITALYYDQDEGKIWIGTQGLGAFRLDPTTGMVKSLSDIAGWPESQDEIKGFCKDSRGWLWIMRNGGGAIVYKTDDDLVQIYSHDPADEHSIPFDFLDQVIEDSRGNIWMSTNGQGLIRFDPMTEIFTHYREDQEHRKSISSDRIFYLFEDSKDNLWICTSKGLDKYDDDTEEFDHYNAQNGFLSDKVRTIIEDDNGLLWLATDLGMYRLDPHSEDFHLFDYADGLSLQEYIQASARDEVTGQLFFGSLKGLLAFNPDSFHDNSVSPPVIISKMTSYIDGKYLDPLVDIFVEEESSIEVSNDIRIIELDLSSLSYHQSEKNKYEYRLKSKGIISAEIVTDWFDLKSERRIRLSNLVPGNYALSLRGFNNDDVPSERETHYSFVIHPPWWKTRSAYVGYFLTFAIIIYLIRRFELNRRKLSEQLLIDRARAEEKQNQALKIERQANKLESSLNELKQKNAEILRAQAQLIQQEKLASLGQLTAGIAHEMKNPLNFVNNFAEGSQELLEDLWDAIQNEKGRISEENYVQIQSLIKDLQQNSVDIIENGVRADRIIHSMMDHTRNAPSEKRIIDINQLLDDNINLAYHGYRALEPSFHVRLRREFDDAIEPLAVFPQELARAFLNILNNACYAVNEKQKTAKGNYDPAIDISTRRDLKEGIIIVIKDNGNGIPDAIRQKIFQPFYTTKSTGSGSAGLGLSISYDIIVNQHHGEVRVNSEDGKYTEFIIVLPV